MVRYLALAHNERHPRTGSPVARVIHNFGRADRVDRDALARLVSSISRFLEPEQAVAAAAGSEVEIVDARRLGGAWTLDRIWERLGIGAAIRRAADGRRLDGGIIERVVFALVAQRALEPGSKLAATGWVAERVAIEGLPSLGDDQADRAIDFLLDALAEPEAGQSPITPGQLRKILAATRLARMAVDRDASGSACTLAVLVFGAGGVLLTIFNGGSFGGC